ncbi:DNA independent RNA polymerase I transcription factor [Oleoguttula sp. CCFEE 5521]
MRPPPTPASVSNIKRPTLGLKRDSSYLDTDDEANLSGVTKRLRVAFSPNVDVRIMDNNWDEKSFELVKEEVRVAIERHLLPADRRDDALYTKLVTMLGQDALEGEAVSGKLLQKYLMALESRVSILGDCGKLVIAVLDLAWLGRDDTFVGLYARLLSSLVSAHSKYIMPLFQRLVGNFARLPASLGRLPDEAVVSRQQMFSRLHLFTKSTLRQVPSATGTLTRVLKVDFPMDLATTKSYIQYQRQLLKVSKYAPELKAEILALIMQRLVSIDVQIQQDLEDLEDEAEERLLQRPRLHDNTEPVDESDDSDNESVSSSEETITEEEQRLREIRLKVAKMDGTLDMLFVYYDPLIRDGPEPHLNDAYLQILSHFITFILPNRTRHAQFLLFHFAQISEEHVTLFTQRCAEIAFGNYTTAQRINAIAYLSSFIARGSHVTTWSVQDVVGALLSYLDLCRQRYEPTCQGPDKRAYASYYAAAQALLYIFCFRWRDLVIGTENPEIDRDDYDEDDVLAESRDLVWLPDLCDILRRNVRSRLNPLKICSPAIAGEFADIGRHVRFDEVVSILESNKRLRLGQTTNYYGAAGRAGGIDIGRRETAWDRKTGDAHHQLEAYFPFDPYHLPQSKKWIEADYNEWKLPRGMKDEEEEEDYSEDDSAEESEDEELEEGFANGVLVDTASTSS